jgi:hypothetical protein
VLVYIAAAALGLLAGLAAGGTPRALADVRLRSSWAVWLAAAAQVGLASLPAGLRPVALVASLALVGWWLVVNVGGGRPRAEVAGLGLAVVGWLANVVVIAANRGMPVSRPALARAGYPASFPIESGHLFKHVAASSSTALAWLGDVIPVGPLRAVISLGDVALGAGIAVFVAAVVASERRVVSVPAR